MSNEEGQWTIRGERKPSPIDRLTAEQVGSIDKLWKKAQELGMDPKELLARAGSSPEMIAAASKIHAEHIAPLRKAGLDPVLQGPFKDRDPNKVIHQRPSRNYKGQVVSKAPIMQDSATAIANVPDLKKSLTRGITNPIYVFDKLPEPLKEFYYRGREALDTVTRRSEGVFKEVDEAAKGLGKKERKRVMAYAIGQQARGPEILKSMGVPAVNALTPKEMKFYEFMRGKLDEMFKQTNEVRTAIGKNPLKELPDYFTFMRSYSFMERMAGTKNGKVDLVLDEPVAIDQMAKVHEGAAFPYTIRAPKGTYALDMDPVAVFKKYAKAAIRHQEVSPIMSEIGQLVKGFPTDKLTVKGNPGHYNPLHQKPNLSEFLVDWSNHLGGMTQDILPPTARWILQGLNRNLAFSTLSANVSSALMQPSSLVGTVAQIGSWHTAKGLGMLFDPRSWDSAMKQSKVLKSRAAELDIRGEGVASIQQKIAEKGLLPLRYLDLGTAVGTWLGAKEFALSRRMGAREAIRFADDVVTKTQASTMATDVAPLHRQTLGRTLGQFQTFMINHWNFLTKDVLGLGGDKKMVASSWKDADAGTIRKTMRYVTAALLANELYKSGNVRAPYPDPASAITQGIAENQTPYEIAAAVAGEFAEVVPFLGNIKYGKTPWGPLVDVTNQLVTGGKYGKTPKKELGDMIEEGAVPENTLEQSARLAGVPGTNQFMKWLRASRRGEEGFDAIVGKYSK